MGYTLYIDAVLPDEIRGRIGKMTAGQLYKERDPAGDIAGQADLQLIMLRQIQERLHRIKWPTLQCAPK